MSTVRHWWHHADQFEWVTAFLRQRGLLRSARLVMATVAASASLVPMSLLVGVTQHHGAGTVVLAIVGIAFTVGMTGYWLTHWPSRRQSETAVIAGALFTGVWSVTQPTPAIAALSCTATAVTGGYIAFFHGTRVLLVNFAVAVTIATAASWRLAESTNLATAVGAFWLIWFLNLSVPVAAYGASRALRVYTVRSEADPLTGLLNRRAFVETTTRLLADGGVTATHATIAMIDLDDFKRINDTHGHAAGDGVLRAVAELLRQHSPADGTVCRAGGEEFLMAILADPTHAQSTVQRLCDAIASLPHRVTASIGTASIERTTGDGSPSASSIEELVAAADVAMYAAKRDGGNRVRHA